MGQSIGRWIRGAALLPVALTAGVLAYAQEDDVATRLAALEETVNSSASAYVDNSYLFLIGGIIVMFMAAGFCHAVHEKRPSLCCCRPDVLGYRLQHGLSGHDHSERSSRRDARTMVWRRPQRAERSRLCTGF